VPHAGEGPAADVHRTLAGRVEQRYEDLGPGLLVGADGIGDDAGAPRVAVLVAQAFIDPSGRVSLPGRGVAFVVDDLPRDGQERAEEGLARDRGARGGGGSTSRTILRTVRKLRRYSEQAGREQVLPARARRRISGQSSMLARTPASRCKCQGQP